MRNWIFFAIALLGLASYALVADNAGQASSAKRQAAAATQPSVTVTLPSDKPLPSSPGWYILEANVTIDQAGADRMSFTMSYGLFLPPSYFSSGDEPFPMVVTLHNVGAKGTGGHNLAAEGMALLWVQDKWDPRHPTTTPADNAVVLRRDARFVGLAPQCPKNLDFQRPPMELVVSELIGRVEQAYRVDSDRIYLTGFSHGGTSTWLIAERLPDRFAAIAPISGRATQDPAQTARRLRHLPIYLGVGTAEWAYPLCTKMNEALQQTKHPNFVFHVVPEGTHWCYSSIYADPNFWNWLLAQKRQARHE